jgi:hypothetical protein
MYLVGSFCVAASVFAFFFVPELKGKTLQQMDEVFGFVPTDHTRPDSSSDASLRVKEKEDRIENV